MIDTSHMRRKYDRRPRLFGSGYWTPAGAKDVLALCDTVDRLEAENRRLREECEKIERKE